MSVRTVSNSGIQSKIINSSREVAPWIRPSDWPTIPAPSNGVQKISGLWPVFNADTNYCAFSAVGNYTVDWGDGGSTENVSSGVTAQHNYSWGASGLSATTSDGYKCAIITITPNGGNLTEIDFAKNVVVGSYLFPSNSWLELSINSVYLTSIKLGPNLGVG